MTSEDLIKYNEKILKLNHKERKLRDLYLRRLSIGEIQGPTPEYPTLAKPWLKYFSEEAIKMDIPQMNIYDYFMSITPDDICLLEYDDKEYYKKDIEQEVDKYIRKFSGMGIKKSDNVTFVLLNVADAFFMYMALAKMGAIANLIRPDEGPERIAFMTNERNSDYMFVSDDEFIIHNVTESLSNGNRAKKIIRVPVTADSIQKDINDERFIKYDEWINKYSDGPYNVIDDGFNDVCVVVFTGGTTGNPKAVELLNRNIVAEAHDFKNGGYGFEKGKTSLNILPTGIAFNMIATYVMMCCGVKVTNLAAFDIMKYPELVEKYKPNIVFAGPILFNLMMSKDVSKDLSFFEIPYSGGDKLHLSEEEAINNYFHSRGSSASTFQGYGMSECMAGAAVTQKDSYVVGSVGIPMPNVTISIFDYDDKDKELPFGEIGEIAISGPNVMKGYGKSSERVDNVLIKHSDGRIWLHTDDLGYMDSTGHLFVQGRAKRMLTRSGTKVFLSELEDAIRKNPNVKDCCCVKMSDAEEREVPVANIVLEDETLFEQTCEELDQLVKNILPLTYIPKYYVLRKYIPITPGNNKVKFTELEKENILNEEEYSINENTIIPKKLELQKSKQ